MSTNELVKASRKAFEASKLPPRELFAHLVRLGWIDARGRVTKLLAGFGKTGTEARAVNALSSLFSHRRSCRAWRGCLRTVSSSPFMLMLVAV